MSDVVGTLSRFAFIAFLLFLALAPMPACLQREKPLWRHPPPLSFPVRHSH